MSETRIHIAIVEYLRLILGHPDRVRVFHCPSGGLRTKREAALFKAMGVMAGIPDILILAPPWHLYAMEVKRPPGFPGSSAGALSAAQEEMRSWFEDNNFPFAVVSSIDQARFAVQAWGLKSVEVAA